MGQKRGGGGGGEGGRAGRGGDDGLVAKLFGGKRRAAGDFNVVVGLAESSLLDGQVVDNTHAQNAASCSRERIIIIRGLCPLPSPA